jgi:hypothetical protein
MTPNHFNTVHTEAMGGTKIGPKTSRWDAPVVAADPPRSPHRTALAHVLLRSTGLPRATRLPSAPCVLLWSAGLPTVFRWLGVLLMFLPATLLALLRPNWRSPR